MKKRFTILTAVLALLAFLTVPLGMRGQTRDVETFTFSELGYGNADDVTTVEGNNVTLTFDQGTGNNAPKYYTNGTAVRMYTGNTLEVALNNQGGEARITAIDFTFSGNYPGSLQNWSGSETSVSFTNSATGQARIQVIAVTFSEGGSTTTYTVTYNANVPGVASVVDTYAEGANVTLRPATTFTYDGYTFSEWNTQADGDGDPYDAGDVIESIQEDLEFYAMWTENPVSDEQWVLTSLADLTESDVFVIVGNNGSNYAMSNDNGTSGAPAAVAVTVANDAITSSVAANIQWNISGDGTDGYTFYPNGSTEAWLYCTNTNNGVRVGTNEANTFKMEASSGYLVHQGTTRYVGVYNSTDWRCYTSINSNIQGQTFAFYKKVSGGVIPPSISAENVSIEYNATSGSIAYTINNGVDGGTVSAAVTEGDWLTLGTVSATVPFTCSANQAGTERTASVTLTYTYNRATVTKDVTVTQAGNPDVTMTIAAARAQGSGDVVTKGVITSITGSNNKTAYIQDETAAIVVYGNFEAAVGDQIRVSGSLSDYNGLLEIINPQVTILSSGNPVLPQLMTIAEVVASTNQGWYIRIEGATVTNITGSGNSQNTTIAQGDNTIVVRGNLGTTVAVNNVINLDGNIGYYNGNQIANPQNVEVQQVVVPSITITPATLNVDAEQHLVNYFSLAYENIEVESAQSFTVHYYNAVGEEIELVQGETWMIAGVVKPESDYQVLCTIMANEGEARSAYFKVSALDAEQNVVYSNLVTINQAEYVAPTYAELPFEFDGGKADIEGTDGLFAEGLGNDYNNSPKLRFDDTDDYLLLQFSEVPGKLTFDIKGNGFSGGTFTVQTSEDGMIYTDLETYTELGAKQSESFNNLGENVRYIKWTYTEKVSGNVALGNIKLAQPTQPYDLTIEPYENLEIFTFIGGDESEAFEGAGTIQVYDGDEVMLSITANEGYEIQSLMVDGVEHVNDIDEAETYTFTMPSHDVTVSATAVEVIPPTPFEPVTYRLATSIESGKSYIIVGAKITDEEESLFFAMGEQRNNNRGGVAISVDGTTATVETEDVHEVVITALDQDGFYSIFDGGYLYAASNGSNYLKTEDELDVNGEWEITIDDGQFSIVASNSENRNVMQFNYNGGNPLFSCYASDSQSPVYLYVRDENPTVSQTLELVEGWNWVSLYVEGEDAIATLLMLETALGENASQISSADFITEYDEEWFGDLDEIGITNDQTYMILAAQDCTVELEGDLSDPASIEITLNPGWNWIGFPINYEMAIEEALADLEAEEGDMLANSELFTEFDGEEWYGDIETLLPGQGFMYFNNSDEVKTFFFLAAKKK